MTFGMRKYETFEECPECLGLRQAIQMNISLCWMSVTVSQKIVQDSVGSHFSRIQLYTAIHETRSQLPNLSRFFLMDSLICCSRRFLQWCSLSSGAVLAPLLSTWGSPSQPLVKNTGICPNHVFEAGRRNLLRRHIFQRLIKI
jgi:hypothetical protein